MQSETAVNFIQKPFASSELLERIRELLDARREAAEERQA
jgi:FixJ family two-component response regulator